MDHLFTPISYCLTICIQLLSDPSRFSSAPHLLSRCKAPPTWMFPAPTTPKPLPLVHFPRSACLRLLPFHGTVHSPLFHPRPSPRSLSAPGGLTRHGSLRASMSLPRPPRVLLRILALSSPWYCCRVDFRVRSRGQGASNTRQSHFLVLTPPATWTRRRRSGDPPPLLTPSPLSQFALVFMLPFLLVE